MPTDDGDGGSLFSRAIRETLDTVVAPGVRDALVADALFLSGLTAIPSNRSDFHRFAEGPLRTVAERAVGPELADTIADEVLRVTQAIPSSFPPPVQPGRRESGAPRSSSGGRRRSSSSGSGPPSRKTATFGTPAARSSPPHSAHPRVTPIPFGARRKSTPSPSPPLVVASISDVPDSQVRRQSEPKMRAATTVLVATTDDLFLETFVVWLGDRAVLHRVDGLMALVRRADESAGRPLLVIVDGKTPSIRPAALAVLLEEISNVEVVMCRAPSETIDAVLAASPGTARWVVYNEPAPLDRCAAECVKRVS